MKITSFSPLIVTTQSEETIKLFEALGFEKHHQQAGPDPSKSFVADTTMKNPDGFRVDVARVRERPQDLTCIRMNVDNFEEAVAFLEARGFRNVSGKVVEAPSSKSCLMVSPSGFGFDVCQHLK